ncbi:small s protein [Diaporthe amygdali]|uniref:small s protein n=1 Tax=Phomopsis amygdali TaxID=1214568 RepID=UPI0022FDFBFA|nr:small s protein [Diaporthe amygdali]KAJ0119786.1 small s protein [Diaporthe amygdali]
MDPISALSLAVNILSVVDFSTKIISATSEIRSYGETVTNSDRRLVSEDLLSCCAKLRAARTEKTALPVSPADDAFYQRLEGLADEALIIAADIQRTLAKQRPGASQSVWKSLRHAILATWGEGKLRDKSERLVFIRNELQFHVIISIKAKVDLQALRESTRVQALDEDTQRLIHAVSTDCEATRQELADRTETLNEKLDEARWYSDKQHQESTSLALHHHREQMNAIRNISNHPKHANEHVGVSTVIQEVLNALWFSRMADRFDDIEPAHHQTFEWIYSGEIDNKLSRRTFMGWMAGESGVYWVSGRAGSGKSTLMKFLAGDGRTKKALTTWAGDRELITANYWFWSQAQDSLQKSLHGFLRALMYDIIQQNGDYARLLFPDRFIIDRDWADFPTYHELKRAFKRLVEADKPPACVALMIDGLDEYEAPEEEHFELARTLKDAARAKHLKIIVSSRPEMAFETTFVDCEKLRLHELTRSDRMVYVTDHLYGHRRFDFLVKQAENGERESNKLITYAVDESEGIFLWLRLVVAALMEDLNTCATLAELQAILDKFPRGLEELYRHMLRRIPEERRTKGIQLVQLVRCAVAISKRRASNSIGLAPPISALMLSVAHSDYRDIIKRSQNPLKQTEHNDIIQRIDHLLRSHCAGLLELKYRMPGIEVVNENKDWKISSSIEDPEIAFLHKSVVEFLDRTDTQSELLPVATDVNRFNPYVSLISCLLYKIKIHTLSNYHWPYKWSLVLRIMHTAVFAEIFDLESTKNLLENLDQTMEQIFRKNQRRPRDAEITTTKQVTHWSCHCPWLQANWHHAREHRDRELPRGGNILSFAMENGLERFPLYKLSHQEGCERQNQAASLLIAACRATTLQCMMSGGIRPAVILQLLKLGANPNCYIEHTQSEGRILSTTPWLEMLRTLRQLSPTSLEGFRQLFGVLKAFLESGADPEAQIYHTRGAESSLALDCTAKDLIQRCFTRNSGGDLIHFVPFEEAWQACGPLIHFPATQSSNFYVPELPDLMLSQQIENHHFLSPSDTKQIAEWGTILIKLLEKTRRRRRAISILHKLACQV